MSEQGEKPEVLPGDLITGPGLYEARCGKIVPIAGWDNGWWTSEWDGALDWYSSDGRRRFYEAAGADEWQLLHWVRPLPATEPEPETTTEQLAEIEGQQADAPATEYTPPEGWRVLAVGEILQAGDMWVNREGVIRPTRRIGERVNDELYIRCDPIEPELEPQPEPRPQPEPVQVREGRWKTRGGEIRNVTPTPEGDGREQRFPWWDAQYRQTWTADGRYHFGGASALDLVEYLGPIEPQPEQKPVPIQVREGRWKTQAGEIVSVSAMPTDDDNFSDSYPWWDGDVTTWANNGVFFNGYTAGKDLVEYLGPIEQQPQPVPEPEPESDAELRIRLLKQANDAQAETIERLQGEARDLNMEIGGLQRQLLQRDARIRDLETIYSAATKSFEDANKANDALRAQVRILQQEASKKTSRIEFLETLDAENAVAIVDYRAKVEKLQGLVDTARGQLEAAATERDELRAAIDAADKQLDQKDAQIRDLRIELEAAQQVQQPVGDEERERIWDEATEAAGRQVVRWLRPLTLALHRQPDERFSRFMALTLSVLPDVLPELLGYAVEDESDCEE